MAELKDEDVAPPQPGMRERDTLQNTQLDSLVNAKVRHQSQVRLLVPETNSLPVAVVVFLVIQCVEVEQWRVDLRQQQRVKKRGRCYPFTA